jgi:hypothetical protein
MDMEIYSFFLSIGEVVAAKINFKKHTAMKKLTLGALVVLTVSIIFAFTSRKRADNEIKIIVTSDVPTTFDLHMFSEGKVLKGITTPYQVTVNQTEAQYILKPIEPDRKLQMKVEKDGKQRLFANMSLIVFTIEGEALRTFGIN